MHSQHGGLHPNCKVCFRLRVNRRYYDDPVAARVRRSESYDRTKPERVAAREDQCRLRDLGLKRCPRCSREIAASDYGPATYCRPCMKQRWHERTPDQVERDRERQKERNEAIRRETFAHYGETCACCGEHRRLFLSIDHMNNDGAKDRRETKRAGVNFYAWLKVQEWPEGYQTLCHNCNLGRHLNGGTCPHEIERLDAEVECIISGFNSPTDSLQADGSRSDGGTPASLVAASRSHLSATKENAP